MPELRYAKRGLYMVNIQIMDGENELVYLRTYATITKERSSIVTSSLPPPTPMKTFTYTAKYIPTTPTTTTWSREDDEDDYIRSTTSKSAQYDWNRTVPLETLLNP